MPVGMASHGAGLRRVADGSSKTQDELPEHDKVGRREHSAIPDWQTRETNLANGISGIAKPLTALAVPTGVEPVFQD